VRLRGLLSWDVAGSLACWLVLPALSLALATPWLPIATSSLAMRSV